jgi:hypothetical protein
MSFVTETYEQNVYSRLEESVLEHFDEDMADKFIPNIKKALCAELDRRRKAASEVESVLHVLFPGEGYEAAE